MAFWDDVGGVLVQGLEKRIDAEIYGTEKVGNQAQYDQSVTTRPGTSTPQPDGVAQPESGNVALAGIQLNKTALTVAGGALLAALLLRVLR